MSLTNDVQAQENTSSKHKFAQNCPVWALPEPCSFRAENGVPSVFQLTQVLLHLVAILPSTCIYLAESKKALTF